MQRAKIISYILFPLFIGLIIGGAIAGNTIAWVCGIVFLLLDIFVGISLQYYISKKDAHTDCNDEEVADFFKQLKHNLENDNWDNMSDAEKMNQISNSPTQRKIDAAIDRFIEENFNQTDSNIERAHEIRELSTNKTAKKRIIKINTTKYNEYKLGSTYNDSNFGIGRVVGIGLGYLNVEFLESQCRDKATNTEQAKETHNKLREYCGAFCEIYDELKATRGIFTFNNRNHPAISLLIGYCKSLNHSPLINSFNSIEVILPLYFMEDTPIILYEFQGVGGYIGEINSLYIIVYKNQIFMFTVERSFNVGNSSPFILCEYDGNRHINYGQVDLNDTNKKIKSIVMSKIK